MRAYKGFNRDLTCLDFQFTEGGTFEHGGDVRICASGFHACESPLEVFAHYGPGTSTYRIVELDGVSDQRDGDSKVVAKKITIGAQINLAGLAKAHVEYVNERLDKDAPKQTKVGDTASNTGYQSAASNTGYQSAATNTGYRSAASNTGDRSAASNTGDRSAATNTGYRSAASNTGAYSAASNTGYQSAATNTGYRSAASNTGDRSAASVEGADSVAIVTGFESRAAGALGCWIVLTERDPDMNILEVRAVKVDGEAVKAGQFYMLKGGELVEVAA